jgi:hypothetical protein
VLRGGVHAQPPEGLAPGIRGDIHDVSAVRVVRTAEVLEVIFYYKKNKNEE